MKFGAERIGGQIETVGTMVLAICSRLPLSWRGVGAVIVGILLARWSWVLFAPHTLFVLPAKPAAGENLSDALFGTGAQSGAAKANTDAALGSVHLVGVFTGKHAFAVLALDDKTQRGVAVGEEVVGGTKLVEVAVDHVVLEQDGIRQRVNLENKSAGSEDLSPAQASTASGVEKAVAGWDKANQELKKRNSSNAHK